MLSRQQTFNLRLHQLADALLLILAFRVAYRWRDAASSLWDLPLIPEFGQFFWFLAIVVPLTPFVLEAQGYYRRPLQKTISGSLRQFGRTLLWVSLAVGIAIVFFKMGAPQSRAVLLLFMGFAPVLLLTKEQLLKVSLQKKIRRGEIRVRAALVGAEKDIDALWDSFPEIDRQQIDVVARLNLNKESAGRLEQIFREQNVERVFLAADHAHFHQIEQAVLACETEGVEACLSTEFLKTTAARPRFDSFGDQPLLVWRNTPENPWELLAKNLLDRLGAAVLLVLTSPLWLAAWIGIKISSPGPVFFCQQRGGRYGQPFRMYKFRTMSTDAEERRKELEARNELDGPAFKITNDPRIFPFGAFLRKTSIDELPQLLNVLRGEMSLVGPRPLPVYEVQKIEKSHQRRRLSVKPGLTCLWQISGRNRITDFNRWVELDLRYIDNWSLWLDFKILFRTIPAVLAGAGAK